MAIDRNKAVWIDRQPALRRPFGRSSAKRSNHDVERFEGLAAGVERARFNPRIVRQCADSMSCKLAFQQRTGTVAETGQGAICAGYQRNPRRAAEAPSQRESELDPSRAAADDRQMARAVRHIADGDVDYPVEVNGPDELGKIADALAVFKRNARELQRSNGDLRTFAYVASHDLRSPLRAIRDLATWNSCGDNGGARRLQ